MTHPTYDATAADLGIDIDGLLDAPQLPTDAGELAYALGNTGECAPCFRGAHEHCSDEGVLGSAACECRRSEAGCSGPNGRGVI